LEVVGDREGNALVMWDDFKGQFFFARWVAAERAWRHPASLMLADAALADTYGSGHPILIGDQVDPLTGERSTIVRRFDVQTDEWGPAQPADFEGTFAYGFYVSMDGEGNVYLLHNRDYENWTWWPVDAETWAPLRTVEDGSRIIGAREAGAWLSQERRGFSVRAFDLGASDWSNEYVFESPQSTSTSDINYFTVGPTDEALAATLRQDQTHVAVYVWRYDPKLAAWQPKETALEAATNNDSTTYYGAPVPITDLLHMDVVAAPVREGDQFELRMNLREPATGIWSPLHAFTGLTSPTRGKFVADASGNLYGCAPPAGLFHYSSESRIWTNPSVDTGCEFAVFRQGAFALGTTRDHELAVYWHPGGDGEWRRAQGLPFGAMPVFGSVPYAISPLSEGHAIVVWQIQSGVRAAFIE